MRENMFEGLWSPFSPEWYQYAFDKYISTDDQLFNQDDIIKLGFYVPDSDQSKSSVFSTNAILNNTFDENKLRETLKDIYLNSSSKLRTSNHDNVNFYQHHTNMKNVKIDESKFIATFSLPTETFIRSKGREIYKLSQFYRKWIHINDLFNNWDVFKFTILLFINKRIYSDYEIRIDEHETIIRFKYEKFWWDKLYDIDVYKFETNYQKRIQCTRRLFKDEWNYKIPVSYVDETFQYDKAMLLFNKINDQSIRTDGIDVIDVMGDNVEFVKVKDGYFDLTNISNFNKILIESENKTPLWMSVIIPKYMHEYPIILPTENIYREYHPNLVSVYTTHSASFKNIKDEKINQVYVDIDDYIPSEDEKWKSMIRPIVLSDAFDPDADDKYDSMEKYVNRLRELTVKFADKIENFRFFLKEARDEEKFMFHIESLEMISMQTKDAYDQFILFLKFPINEDYENKYKRFMTESLPNLVNDKYSSNLLSSKEGSEWNIFSILSPLVYIPRKLADRYYVAEIIKSMGKKKIFWEDIDKYSKQIRFTRPIDVDDFMFFEYNIKKEVWRPVELKADYHFPDVYIISDPNNKPLEDRIFKAFIFYSDTINVLKESVDIRRATPEYDSDLNEYEINKQGVFRNIFMEKFYWMAIKSIYGGSLRTKSRWEQIEYVINNPSYRRFNELFIKTMEPYFKIGMANYLKNDNFLFTFDYMISKLKESIDQKMMNYNRLTNYQIYLNKTWKPSYFDYAIEINDEFNHGDRLIKRPPASFDINRLLNILKEIEESVNTNSKRLSMNLNYIIEKCKSESYNLDENMYDISLDEFNSYTDSNIENINELENKSDELIKSLHDKEIFPDIFEYEDGKVFINSTIGIENLKYLLDKIILYNKELNKFIIEFDLDIYSIEDTEKILRSVIWYNESMNNFKRIMKIVFDDSSKKNQYEKKRELLNNIKKISLEKIEFYMNKLSDFICIFDMDKFMKVTNDLDTLKNSGKINENDHSLIGEINKFDLTQPDDEMKVIRNKLFVSTTQLNTLFHSLKPYPKDEIFEYEAKVLEVKQDLINTRIGLHAYWKKYKKPVDQKIIDKLDNSEFMIKELYEYNKPYMEVYRKMLADFDIIHNIVKELTDLSISKTERKYLEFINEYFDAIILALSYIAAKNQKSVATDYLNIYLDKLNQWFNFIDIEESVFTKILDSTRLPSEFTDLITIYSNLINEIIICLSHLNDFIPDMEFPTYIDVFEVNEYEISNKGFRHKIGNVAYVPNLSSYKIMKTDDDVNGATELQEMNYRKTTFRNPMIQKYPYFSITTGKGLDLRVKPKSVNTIKVINDKPLERYITVCEGILRVVRQSLPVFNSINNYSLSDVLDKIEKIKEDWKKLLLLYSDHMTEAKDKVDTVIKLMDDLIDPLKEYIDMRFNINVQSLLNKLESFTIDTYKYFRTNSFLTGNYFFYDDQVRETYNNLFSFYGSSDNWSNSSRLVNLVEDIKVKIIKFHKNILTEHHDDNIMEEYYDVLRESDKILNNIKDLTVKRKRIRGILFNNETAIKRIDKNFHEDKWFKINKVNVSTGGSGYNIGDIIQLVQELPLDKNGNPIKYQEDLILNDVILFQVMRVDTNGSILRIKPFMDYAIPYRIYGSRQTSSRIGKGEGCILNINSDIVDYKDSYLFFDKDKKNYIDQYNETDLLKFKFENIHDLAIDYEVFFAGLQTNDFLFRHLKDEDDDKHPNEHLKSSKYDAIYIYANDVMNLKNSSYRIKAENYFKYRIDEVEVIDPGSGYYAGQTIYVDSPNGSIKLKIKELDGTPLKGIKSIDVLSQRTNYDRFDPSTENGEVIKDTINNIDDEYHDSDYDMIPEKGIKVPTTKGYPETKYSFIRKRYSKLKPGRNTYYMTYLEVDNKLNTTGDPDGNWYLGSRLDNSQVPYEDKRRWNGIENIVPITDPFIPDKLRTPPDQPINSEFQQIQRLRIHNSEPSYLNPDLRVERYADIPKYLKSWENAKEGKIVLVDKDEMQDNHRTVYTLRSISPIGYLIYDEPFYADIRWNVFKIDFNNIDSYPDYPSLNVRYKSNEWRESKTFLNIRRKIYDGKILKTLKSLKNKTSYIHNIRREDLSVFNYTTKQWEDLNDYSRWKFKSYYDKKNHKFGFDLMLNEEGKFDYDMILYFNKTSDNQTRNSKLKKNAVLKIKAVLEDEVDIKESNVSINIGRDLRIRKLFPYKQKETFTIGTNYGYEMKVKLNNYIHFKNELHLSDVKLFNKTANRYEDIFDSKIFEVRFKNDKYNTITKETNTRVIRTLISDAGSNFYDGSVYAYNTENGIYLSGNIKTHNGNIIRFIPTHCPNPPKKDIALEFFIHQHSNQTDRQIGKILVEFSTTKDEIYGDGYIHNVTNRLAPLPREFSIFAKYNIDECVYEVTINKNPKVYQFVYNKWIMNPEFKISDTLSYDRIYAYVDGGRFPLINPITLKPTLEVNETETGTSVVFKSVYKKNERFEIHSVPYPMRSVYTQRIIPKHGYINLKGKLNKPLDKQYFEFWVNGRLMDKEVSIITPTKIIFHGLRSLRNLEIIEINRDANEYFSDVFLYNEDLKTKWDLRTYLDDVLEGTLKGDNYRIEEQELLLTPIWRQVELSNPEFKNYPPNINIEKDIMQRVSGDDSLTDLLNPSFSYIITNIPTIEGRSLNSQSLTFSDFGLRPLTEEEIIDLMNEEWKDEIDKGIIDKHNSISDDSWYGMVVKMYDEFSNEVTDINQAAYKIFDSNIIKINADIKLSRIIKNNITYDLD